jgi:hypothetical protein
VEATYNAVAAPPGKPATAATSSYVRSSKSNCNHSNSSYNSTAKKEGIEATSGGARDGFEPIPTG